eukprot:TRINITY_DN1118_c0_g2_i2.p1 TRINITY_DN1118_c0_g2~~TRINITY_DN1118_c0_g2_i2.p1  ORF type:complete len:314 (-),score=101.86 TRINITY_DN1118_c0_g2_i2:296-1237(-)
MMECQKALAANNDSIEESIKYLREHGISIVQKKSSRQTAEGLVGLTLNDQATRGAVVELNSETDFLAKNELFQQLLQYIPRATLAYSGARADSTVRNGAMHLSASDINDSTADGKENVKDAIEGVIQSTRENIQLRRAAVLETQTSDGVIGHYTHMASLPNVGKMGVLVSLEASGAVESRDELAAFGEQLAMHIATTNPLSIDINGLSPAEVLAERDIQLSAAKQSGKPENVLEKIVDGKMRKWYEEVVLQEQAFVLADKPTAIKKLLQAQSKVFGVDLSISGFVRFKVGEGIEVQTKDFAQEVAEEMARGSN